MLLLSKMAFWDLIQILSTFRIQKLNQSCNQPSKTHLLIIKKVIFVLKKGRQLEELHFNINLKLMVSLTSNRLTSVIAISKLSGEVSEIENFIKWNKWGDGKSSTSWKKKFFTWDTLMSYSKNIV